MPELLTAVPESDGVADVEENTYHADRGSLSVSGAKLLLPPSCPAKFKEAMDNPPKPKREYDFGHLAHRLLLGKGAEIAVLDPAVHGLKKDGTIADSPRATAGWKLADAVARDRGQTPVHIDEFDTAVSMAEEVRRHPVAGRLFEHGQAELALYHTDSETGVRLRGRVDWLTPSGDVVDYKSSTTANPAELERKFWQFGYYMQAAWYMDLIGALGISEDPQFRFVVQEKTPPYVVTVVRYTAEAIAKGRRDNRRAIGLYVECRERDVWPFYVDGEAEIGLPRWVSDYDAPDEEPTHTTLYDLIEID